LQTKGSFSSKNICTAGALSALDLWLERLGVAWPGGGTMSLWHTPDTQIWPVVLRAVLSPVPCSVHKTSMPYFAI